MPANPAKDEDSKATIAMDASMLLLSTLKAAANYAPVPFLSESAGMALGLLEIVQKTRDNRTSFKALANEACNLVLAAMSASAEQTQGGKAISSDLDQQLKDLLETLTRIRQFADSRAHRNPLLRVISNNTDAGKIEGYRAEIKHALDRFSMQSHISVRGSVSRIEEQQKEILAALVQHASPSPADTFSTNTHLEKVPLSPPNYQSGASPPPSPLGYQRPSYPPYTYSHIPQHVTTIQGNYVVNTNSSTVNTTNSGNLTTINTVNSNNHYGRRFGPFGRSTFQAYGDVWG